MRDLNIRIDYNDDEYKGKCWGAAKTKTAFIYAWGKGKRPKDYIFHEILHLCQKEIVYGRNRKSKREKEEIYIQDLCQIIEKEMKL
jgi:hypothetical protein